MSKETRKRKFKGLILPGNCKIKLCSILLHNSYWKIEHRLLFRISIAVHSDLKAVIIGHFGGTIWLISYHYPGAGGGRLRSYTEFWLIVNTGCNIVKLTLGSSPLNSFYIIFGHSCILPIGVLAKAPGMQTWGFVQVHWNLLLWRYSDIHVRPNVFDLLAYNILQNARVEKLTQMCAHADAENQAFAEHSLSTVFVPWY